MKVKRPEQQLFLLTEKQTMLTRIAHPANNIDCQHHTILPKILVFLKFVDLKNQTSNQNTTKYLPELPTYDEHNNQGNYIDLQKRGIKIRKQIIYDNQSMTRNENNNMSRKQWAQGNENQRN